ncbi:Alpha/beta-Hydrolases superfamily protein [Hibiscus syriacus]|uniref:Alpha/beta-Hydrolases superfamily protein n=1 Tax=Hibiscus syriacus TaxID=106335 RepID=A0A6A3AXH7_HIBSY|nr:Alpha/beta-Hydrolases superfamily protein [Hibiscus syriacus]
MGEYEGWAAQHPPIGLLPNGLLPNEAASVIRILDSERWMKAEERTADLIACIQPDAPSEGRRNAVADYVQRLISKCFPCQVFTFGSVPLKTYLPDGDIDLTAFSKNQNLKDTWAHQVRDMLENEEKNENAEFRVKEVQYIQAEDLKCTNLSNVSVKIIKCLVENIVVDISFNQLGGLCTLCFLEEVDLLINQNHLFKRSIILIKAWCYYESRILGAHHGLISTYALETLVLYIFHVYNKPFSGPLEVLYRFLEFFSKFDWENFVLAYWVLFQLVPCQTYRRNLLEEMESCYLANIFLILVVQDMLFAKKTRVNPLLLNISMIRSAFAFGAKKLAGLLDCPKEDLYYEVNQFFMNTWERHGSGQRPDAPRNDLWHLRLSNLDHTRGFKNTENNSNSKRNDASSQHETQTERARGSLGVSSQHVYNPLENKIKINDASSVFRTQSLKSHGAMSHSKTSDQGRWDSNSSQNIHNGIGKRIPKAENGTDVQGRYLFARTCSSPELTETYGEDTSQQDENRMLESGKTQIPSTRSDNNRRKNIESDLVARCNIKSSCDDSSSFSQASSHQSIDAASDANDLVNSYQDDLGLGTLVALMVSIGLASNSEDPIEVSNENFSPPEMNSGEVERDLWHEHDRCSSGGFDLDNGCFELLKLDDKQLLLQVDIILFHLLGSMTASHASSLGSKNSSESSWEGSPAKAEEHDRDWNLPSIVGTEMAERTTEPQLVGSSPVPEHLIPGSETAQTIGSDPLIPIAPFLLDPGSGQRTMDNSGVPPLAFTITGPPVPFLLCPVYNIPTETGTPDASTSHFSWDEGLDNNQSCQILNHPRDLMNMSHWQNLQYGRFCQNSRFPPPLIYPSPLMVPPVYLQGHFPWDGPGRPLSSNVNHFPQLMNYGPRIVSDTSLQSVSNRPASVYQRHADEMSRYRSGTGTYLPNPKVSMRERHSANAKRGKYSYDRNDHHSDRDGNWNANSKSQAAGYSRSCNQNEKSRFTCDQSGAVSDMPYGMYPLSAMNPGGVFSNGHTIPSVVMLYPYDHNSGYGSPDEQLDFGSLGPVGFSGMNEEVSQLSDGSSQVGYLTSKGSMVSLPNSRQTNLLHLASKGNLSCLPEGTLILLPNLRSEESLLEDEESLSPIRFHPREEMMVACH